MYFVNIKSFIFNILKLYYFGNFANLQGQHDGRQYIERLILYG